MSDLSCSSVTKGQIKKELQRYFSSHREDSDTITPKILRTHLETTFGCKFTSEERSTLKDIFTQQWKKFKGIEEDRPKSSKKSKPRSRSKSRSKSRSRSRSPGAKPVKTSKTSKRFTVASTVSSKSEKVAEPLVGVVSPPEMGYLSSADVSELKDMCIQKKPLKTIIPKLKSLSISQLNGVSIYKIKKDDLCDILTRAAGKAPPSQGEEEKYPIVDPKTCNTRAYTIKRLQEIIATNGWPAPTGKDKKTKEAICDYIERMSGSVPAAPAPPSPATFDLPDDYEKCESSRNLSIAKIKAYASSKGWTDFPKAKEKKAKWCSWLKDHVEESKTIPQAPPQQPIQAPPSPLCSRKTSWESEEDLSQDISCPGTQICDIDAKQCRDIPPSELEEAKTKGMKMMKIPLSSGKEVTVLGKRENLSSLRAKISACGTITEGTEQQILEDLGCEPGKVCDIQSKRCVDSSAVGPGLTKIRYKDRDIVGTPEQLKKLEKTLGASFFPPPADQTSAAAPTGPIGALKKPKKIDKSMVIKRTAQQEEEEARNLAALQQMLGIQGEIDAPAEKRKLQEQKAQEIAAAQAEEKRRETLKKQEDMKKAEAQAERVSQAFVPEPSSMDYEEIEEREESDISRLVDRLKSIQATKETGRPVKLMSEISQLPAKLSLCVGLSS